MYMPGKQVWGPPTVDKMVRPKVGPSAFWAHTMQQHKVWSLPQTACALFWPANAHASPG